METRDPPDLAQAIQAGERVALAQGITRVESGRPNDRAAAEQLVQALLPQAGRSFRYGITGIPGVGKSTFIEAFGLDLIERGHRVAVLAVDPSSSTSGGSILGDKTRMPRLAIHPAAFVRPTATGGALGGLARRTREAMILCEAAGYDRILIETVGVGQNELAVDRLADLTLLLLVSGTGDELQGIKRGIMETADVLVINKIDTAGPTALRSATADLQQAVHFLPAHRGRHPKVLAVSSLTGDGISALTDHVEDLLNADGIAGTMEQDRRAQALAWMQDDLDRGLVELGREHADLRAALPRMEALVAGGSMDPFQAVSALLDLIRRGAGPPP